ncbi:MAG: hypothetical protein QHH07_08965 [Sedimentisphaerales bacterium]|nr:hypothetical protein [Sedimentisphaerales bacterium]
MLKKEAGNIRQGCLNRMFFAALCLALASWGIAHAGGKVTPQVVGEGTVTEGGFKMQNGDVRDFPNSSTLMISATPKKQEKPTDPEWFFNGWEVSGPPYCSIRAYPIPS